MAVVQMQKIAVIVHRSKEDELLDFLQQEGVMEVSNIPESVTVDHTEVNYKRAELDFAITRLTEFADKKTKAALKRKPTEEQVIKAALHTDVLEIIEAVHALEASDLEVRNNLNVLEGKAPAGGTDFEQPAYFTSSAVKDQTEKIKGGAVSPEKQEEMKKVEMGKAEKQLEENQQKRVQLAQNLYSLTLARQYLDWLHDKQAVRESLQRTRSTVIGTGWLPKDRIAAFEGKLQRVLPESALLRLKADDSDEPPVMLRNPKILQPFESVTTLYGLPQATELDPTPIISLFFILFFGLCLTDAGYGLVLSIIMGIFIWKKKLSIEDGRLWWLLFIGGIVTFFVSIPFGGWFGLTPVQVQGFLPSAVVDTTGDGVADLFKGQIWNLGETKGITFFQNLSLILGIIHLSLGIFMAGLMKWRNDSIAAGFWSDWTSLILFGTAAWYFLAPVEMKQIALYAIYASVALVIWGKGYGSKWYLRPIFGLLGIVNLAMGMLSNTLSYLRLLALGLVTGALALAVNLVAEQIGALFPLFVAIPVMMVIYFLGHLVNIALNTLGAFIHSGRLQFVEFFGQYFEGGGRPFTPFKRSLTSSAS